MARRKPEPPALSRRERQIMDILHRRGEATVNEVLEELPDPPSYSAVRATMRILMNKGHATHRVDGPRYIYSPMQGNQGARTSAISHLLKTFFAGSAREAMATLLELEAKNMTQAELDELEAMIDKARSEGK